MSVPADTPADPPLRVPPEAVGVPVRIESPFPRVTPADTPADRPDPIDVLREFIAPGCLTSILPLDEICSDAQKAALVAVAELAGMREERDEALTLAAHHARIHEWPDGASHGGENWTYSPREIELGYGTVNDPRFKSRGHLDAEAECERLRGTVQQLETEVEIQKSVAHGFLDHGFLVGVKLEGDRADAAKAEVESLRGTVTAQQEALVAMLDDALTIARVPIMGQVSIGWIEGRLRAVLAASTQETTS